MNNDNTMTLFQRTLLQQYSDNEEIARMETPTGKLICILGIELLKYLNQPTQPTQSQQNQVQQLRNDETIIKIVNGISFSVQKMEKDIERMESERENILASMNDKIQKILQILQSLPPSTISSIQNIE